MAIIGVIAAITIPSIIANHRKTELEARFAKTYRTIMHMVNMAVAEHGDISTWDWKDGMEHDDWVNFVETYFYPYLNIAKRCHGASVSGCFAPGVVYKALNGADWQMADGWATPRIMLADGSSLRFYFNPNFPDDKSFALNLYFDVNGHKKPNTLGRDTFAVGFYHLTGEILPFGVNYTYNEEEGVYNKMTPERIASNCGGGGQGHYCAARLVKEGFKMNY